MKSDLIPAELIIRKRDGGSLERDEWAAFFSAYRSGDVTEYQVAALLMAIFFQGLTRIETEALTEVMIESGEQWSWGDGAPVGDKHSTGGVGDKVSLVLAPLAAACGLRVPMVSGRGLGHTAGTLDKMESIPGYGTDLDREEFERLLGDVGYAMGGQTEDFAPLDRELYALRDVTGTIESVPLITASILSKKLAEGLDALVLDVKWGDGAFMREHADAVRLARSMIEIGGAFGVRTEALLTDMNAPLGHAVGHAVEMRESIAMLKGEIVDPRLAEVTIALTARLLIMTGAAGSEPDARDAITEALGSGAALERFVANVAGQGGDPAVAERPLELLPLAEVERVLEAPESAFLASLPARAVGNALVALGGGRRLKGEDIDRGVGFWFPRAIGTPIEAGEPWARVYARTDAQADAAAATLKDIVAWSDEPVAVADVVTDRLT